MINRDLVDRSAFQDIVLSDEVYRGAGDWLIMVLQGQLRLLRDDFHSIRLIRTLILLSCGHVVQDRVVAYHAFQALWCQRRGVLLLAVGFTGERTVTEKVCL